MAPGPAAPEGRAWDLSVLPSASLPVSSPSTASPGVHLLMCPQNKFSAVPFGWVVEHFIQFTLKVLILIFLIFPLIMSV